MQGILSQRWADVQEQAYRDGKDKKELTGGRWAKTLVRELFSQIEIVFKKRNDRLHKNETTNNERQILEVKIR